MYSYIMKINTDYLENALLSLKKAIDRATNNPSDEEVRDATIQRFENSYELSWKLLKRQLEADSAATENIDKLSFKDLIREGAEKGLIDNPGIWFTYREHRNITSHTYSEDKAILVFNTACQFYHDAAALLQKIKSKQND